MNVPFSLQMFISRPTDLNRLTRSPRFPVAALKRIFGEASEKNLYLSQLVILDTLEKCLAGVSLRNRKSSSVRLLLPPLNVTSKNK